MFARGTVVRLWRRGTVRRLAGVIAVAVLLAGVVAPVVARNSRAAAGSGTAAHAPQPSQPRSATERFRQEQKSAPRPKAAERLAALRQARALPRSPLGGSGGQPGAWVPLGPQPILDDYATYYAGPVSTVAVNPTNSSDVWLGTPDSGIWHSTDGGTTWTPEGDSLPTQSIGVIAIDPSDPNTIYAGTGYLPNEYVYVGLGVLKSTDDGNSWTLLGQNVFGGLAINQIAIDPTNPQVLLVAADDNLFSPNAGGPNSPSDSAGIWRSTNGGASWSLVLHDSTANAWADAGTDVLFDPANPNTAIAALGSTGSQAGTGAGGIYVSSDNGQTWTQNTSTPVGAQVGYVHLAISRDGSHVYSLLAIGYGSNVGELINDAIYVSTNSGATWTGRNAGPIGTSVNIQEWNTPDALLVDPTDTSDNTVYAGDFRSTDGGSTWTGFESLGVGTGPYAIAFESATTSAMYFGDSVGIYSGSYGASYTNLSNTLSTGRINSASIGEAGGFAQLFASGPGEIYDRQVPPTGVTRWQDYVGTNFFDGNGATVVDYTDNAIVYEADGNGSANTVYKSTQGTYPSFSNASTGINASDVSLYQPLVMSPNNHNELFFGTDRVYQTTNGASSWAPISPIFDQYSCSGHTCDAFMSAIAVAPGADNVIYAAVATGFVYVSTDDGANWSAGTPINDNACSGVNCFVLISSLAVDPTNPQVAYATVEDYTAGPGQHVYKTTNGGASWTDISQSLPSTAFNSIVVDPASPSLVIAASDAGVFDTPDGGATWYAVGTGLPNTVVNQVMTNPSGTKLFAATGGRGVWMLTTAQFAVRPGAVATTTEPGVSPPSQTISITNTGIQPLNWSETASLPAWLTLSSGAGTVAPGTTQQVTLTFNTPSATPQTYTTDLVFSDSGADNSPVTVPVTVVSASVSKTWYFAEGYTGTGFTTYLTIANPNNVAANVQVQYLIQHGSPVTKTYTISANNRYTITVNKEIGSGLSVSMAVTADQFIVAERPEYFTYTGPGVTQSIPGGSDVVGATTLASSYDFGYVDTSANHATYLTVLNQNRYAIDANVEYFPAGGGTPLSYRHVVAASSRGTIIVNDEAALPPGSYSALVSLVSDVDHTTPAPGLVERPMYLVDATTGFTGSADVVGVARPLTSWYFAEGYTGAANPGGNVFDERYILSNPGNTTANVTVTFFEGNGTSKTASAQLAPGTQQIVDANAVLGGPGVNNSAAVTSDQPILAERFMSFDYKGPAGSQPAADIPGATDVLGASQAASLFYFAEGYTGGEFAEYLTLGNTNPSSAATVQVTFLPTGGGSPVVRVYTIPPATRFTLNTASVMPQQSFSMVVESSGPIVAERPMYFSYSGPFGATGQTGGTDVIGYTGG